MRFLERFFPDRTFESAYALDAAAFKARGIKGVILDIDNTLVSPNAPADENSRRWIAALKEEGIECFILSNNSEKRASSFAAEVDCAYLAKARKPRADGFLKAVSRLGTNPDETVVLGDQLITDVLGAHRAGLKAWWVSPLDPANEQPFVRVKRILEKPIFAIYRKQRRKNS